MKHLRSKFSHQPICDADAGGMEYFMVKKTNFVLGAMAVLLFVLAACAPSMYVPQSREASEPSPRVAPATQEAFPAAVPTQLGVTEDTNPAMITTFEEVARTPWLAMYADLERGAFAIRNLASNKIWYSIPLDILLDETTRGAARLNLQSQIVVTFVFRQDANTTVNPQSSNSQAGVLNTGNVNVTKLENGIRVEYYFAALGFNIPVEYRITDDFLEASVDIKNMDEGELCFLLNINLLPSFGAGNLETEGYLFVPDGSGVLVSFNRNFQMNAPYEAMVYGRDMTVVLNERRSRQETIRLPVFGTLIGDDALMGVITQGDGAASILFVNGNAATGYNAVSSRVHIRHWGRVQSLFREINGNFPTITQITHTPFAQEFYRVRYYFLHGEEASLVGMAQRYREFLADERNLERNPQSPAFALELFGNIDVEANFAGISYSRNLALTTYRQAVEIIEMLQRRGINNIALRYIGWDNEGVLNTEIPTSANPSRGLGGRREFNEMLAFLHNNGISYYLETDPVRFRNGGGGVRRQRDSSRSPHRIPALLYGHDLVTHALRTWTEPYRLLRPSRLIPTASVFAESFGRLGASGIGLGVLGESVFSDFADNTGVFRSVTIDIYEAIFEMYREMGINIAISGGNAYAVPFAERIFDAPIYSSGFDVFGQSVPFYQMVFQGWVTMTSPAIMQSTRPDITFLKTVSTGMEMLYAGIYADASVLHYTRFDNLFSTTASLWADKAAEQFLRYYPLHSQIYNQEIISFTNIDYGITLTVFENGINVLVNFTNYDAEYNGRNIDPMNFVWWQ